MLTTALHKTQMCAFLGLPPSVRTSKTELNAQLQQLIDADPDEYTRLLDTFVNELAVGPKELEELLHCTKVERVRWIKEGRLPVLEYCNPQLSNALDVTFQCTRGTFPMHWYNFPMHWEDFQCTGRISNALSQK
jgi:hypothetical protein